MDFEVDSKCFFNKCSHNINLKLGDHREVIYGSSKIILESETEFPNKIFFQTPSLFYCNVKSVEVNGNNFEGWSINPVPTLDNSNKIVGHNVFDIITLQMAYGFVSSNYGETSSDKSSVIENRLLISISDENRLYKTSNGINENESRYLLTIKVNFELLLNVLKSPITYVIEEDNSINISIIPNEYSKLPWFPTLSCSLYLTEDNSPFWNSQWNFKCTVPNEYSAIMPGILKASYPVNETNKNSENTYEYHYDSGISFPHLYPNNVVLFIGKYNREDKIIGKNAISIFRPINVIQTINISNFVAEIIEGYEKILNNTLPMKMITIIFSNYHFANYYSQSFVRQGRVSDTLGNIEMLSNAPSPLIYQENNYYCHLNEIDIGKTISNIIIIPLDIFFPGVFSSTSTELNKKNYLPDNFRMQIRNLTAPIVILLDRLASLWFGSYIHVTNWKRLPTDSWMLLGMKRYIMRQMAKKLCGEDLVKCRMKEALERCLILIENGNDYIPLSVKDLYIQLQQNGTRSCPLIHWSQRESQTLFRLKSDIVFHSLECYVNQMIRSKARKVGFGFGFSDFDYSIKQINSHSKHFNTFIQSFIYKHCIKKNHRNFTTQHFFIHIASCISQQFIHRSKKEIAAAQLPQHEKYMLNEIQDELLAFRSAWVEGVGCPNLTITSTFQFSNKNTSLDNALFTVDQTPIQPPHLTSKEGISSFIPLVSIFRVKKNITPKNDIEMLIFEYLSFIEGNYSNLTTKSKSTNFVTKFLPSFLWPHDPNNIILKESNVTILGLGSTGRVPVPIKFGFGPLFDSVFDYEYMESTKGYVGHQSNIESERLTFDKNSNYTKQSHISNKKNVSVSSNGSICSWQFGYMNILCQIILKHHKSPLTPKKDIEWLCTELASHIPISGGTGKFWPGHTSIYIVQNEENKICELETIEPQLPVCHEIRFETQKTKPGYKRDVSVSSANITSSVCVQGVSNSQNPITHTNIKMNEAPRLSLLHDLQQRKHFVGKLSNSDNIWLQPFKFSRHYKDINNSEKEKLQMSYMVNPVNLSAHLLWIVADSSQYWLAKISRYQTWSMWDQQFLNETDVIGQLEAAHQLGMERYFFGNNHAHDLNILERAFQSLNVLMNALYHFDWNISIRKKALISILKIHNKLSFQVSIKSDVYSIKTTVFSFIKNFILELISIIRHRIIKELCNSTANILIFNETDILLFSIKSLSYLWDSETSSTSFEVIHFLSELLGKYINKYHDQIDYEILVSIFEAIERMSLPATKGHLAHTIEKIISTINKFIIDIIKNCDCSHISENFKIFGVLFRILSKHPIHILTPVSTEFRNVFGSHFDPLWFIDLPFTINVWWYNYSSLHGTISKPLYKFGDPIFQLQALRCYFSLSLQGFTEIMIVFSDNNLGNNVQFKPICPETIYDMISESFFECNTSYSHNSNLTCESKKSYTLNIIGIFNIWNFTSNNPGNISANIFPRNLLKTLSVCTLIHIILHKGIQENFKLEKNNSNYWKLISSLWTMFISAFDDIVRDLPHLLDEFVLIQARAEFAPLISSLTNNMSNDESTLSDIKQCCAFISQIILNSPISLSSYPFDPLIFQNISNIYVSLFGHGVPICMSQPPFIPDDTNPNQLIFDNGYILSGVPEMPMKDSLRKRQKFIRRGCDLSDSIQIRRLCDDESYIISRGWKHMCKKITQCLIESPYGAPFIHPVDESDAPEYYNLIEQPIDLTTIMNKIKQDSYESIEQFRSDINLIFINCKKYNESNSLIVEWSNKVQSEFDQLFRPVCRLFA